MATLLVIEPGRKQITDALFHLLVAETGEVLATHFCSNYTFAKGDLYENRPERIEEYRNRFGEVEVKYIEETDLSVDELIKRNHSWYEANKETIEKEGPSGISD